MIIYARKKQQLMLLLCYKKWKKSRPTERRKNACTCVLWIQRKSFLIAIQDKLWIRHGEKTMAITCLNKLENKMTLATSVDWDNIG